MQIMQSTLFRWNTTILSFSQIPTPICHQMQSTNQWNCTTYPQEQESRNWLGKQGIPRFWIALEEEENQRSPFYRLPESKYKHITKWTDESWKRNWDFQLLERVQPACQENIFPENSNQEPNRKNSQRIMNILNEITNLLPVRKRIIVWWNTHRERRGPSLCSWKRHHWMPKIWVWNVLLEIISTVHNFINHYDIYSIIFNHI